MKSTSNDGYINSRNFLLLVSFIEGAIVMAIELISAKMMAPYFGTSTYVWTSILIITLLGLSLGYYLGGWISKKYTNSSILFNVVAFGSIAIGLMPIVAPWIIEKTMTIGFVQGSILSSLVFLTPPLIFCGMVSPIIITRLSMISNQIGKSAGTVYAISTIGGVLATFFTGFYVIPNHGLRLSTGIIAIIFGLIPVFYYYKSKKLMPVVSIIGVLVVLFCVNVMLNNKGVKNSKLYKEIYRSDGLLGQVFVVEYKNKKNPSIMLHINNISQTHMHKPSGRSMWKYVNRLATFTACKPSGSRVLLAGLGGGNVVKELNRLGFVIDVCDLDKRMAKVSREFFDMPEPNSIVAMDARRTIRMAAPETYDIVILDMSAGENQPTNVYTVEGFSDLRKILKPDGILFLHYPSIMNGEEGIALKSIGKTLITAGFQTNLLRTTDDYNKHIEFMYMCFNQPTNIASLDFSRRDPWTKQYNFPILPENIFLNDVNFDEGHVLVDDKPLFDKLHQKMVVRYRTQGINITAAGLIKEGLNIF
ncbi:MAG: fused MFS/spermidine synthase [Flavobacteriales bacterium]|nr:fused MFS/spermidine synthase [Flavobacteriales bacterium]